MTPTPISIQNYYWLFNNMDDRTKIELINWLSKTLLKKEDTLDDFFDCFGAFVSDKTAEQQVEEIRASRYFTDKKIEL